jgi:hypothetical protein
VARGEEHGEDGLHGGAHDVRREHHELSRQAVGPDAAGEGSTVRTASPAPMISPSYEADPPTCSTAKMNAKPISVSPIDEDVRASQT